MTKQFLVKYWSHIFLVISIFIIIASVMNINSLKKEIIILQDNLDIQRNEINTLNIGIEDLNKKLFETNSTLNKVEKEKSNLEKDYSDLKQETNELIDDVEKYQKEIKESLEWYKKNSLLDDSNEQKRVKTQIDNNCFEVDRDECRIKLGCFYLINLEKLDLEYHYDETIYDKDDKLSSIGEFITNGGGDCEDYSLFFKAEYNYAMNQCEGKKIILEGWKYPDSEDREVNYWLNFQKTWYLDDVAKVDITEYIFPNIICGNLYDPILRTISGHCIIAFSTKKIETISDLKYLDGAYLIEPQDGSYQGNLNNENSGVYLLNKNVWYDDSVTSWVYSVITDNDYFLFSEENLIWQSYTSFDSLLNLKKNQISITLK